MRVACSQILILLSGGVALAQPAQPTTPAVKTAEEIREIDERVAFWLKTWDPATHMSRSEWKTTCHRRIGGAQEISAQGSGLFHDQRPQASSALIRSCEVVPGSRCSEGGRPAPSNHARISSQYASACHGRFSLGAVSERPTAYRPRKLSCKDGGSRRREFASDGQKIHAWV